jgi:hypothetical protein
MQKGFNIVCRSFYPYWWRMFSRSTKRASNLGPQHPMKQEITRFIMFYVCPRTTDVLLDLIKSPLQKPGAVRLQHIYGVHATSFPLAPRRDSVALTLALRVVLFPSAFSSAVMSDIFRLRFGVCAIPSPSPVVSRLPSTLSSRSACFYFPCHACLALDCLRCCLG